MSEPIFLIVDLFCGFGGTTTGFAQAEIEGNKIAKVIACVNHDPKAIKSHWLNHPDVKHFEEDIRTLDLTGLIEVVAYWRKKYPNAYLVLWASLECTNFSKAKGGQPRDADSRTLAEHLFRYREALDPDYVKIENVVEFMSWGPLDDTGKPLSRKNGQDWMRWRNEMCSFGFYDDWKELNSADYGAYTSRNRLFGCFAKHGLPIIWPQATHSKKASKGMFDHLKKWMPVKEVLDFTDEGESIFNRKKPLSDKTLERIYAGLIKYVAKGDTSFISKYYSGKPSGKNISVEGPAGTVTTIDSQALVQTEGICLLKYDSTDKTGKHYPPSLENPAPVVITQSRLGLIQGQFLTHYYSNGGELSSVNSPAPTISTRDRTALINTEFATQQVRVNCDCGNSWITTEVTYEKEECPNCGRYSGTITFLQQLDGKSSQNQSVEYPAGTVMPNDKHSLVQCESFIMPTNYDNKPKSIEEPSPTITSSRKHHYIINPSHGGNTTSTDAPCPVIIARQDKAPLYMVQCDTGVVQIAVYDGESEVSIRIKQFMVVYSLVDIKMRMLRVHELLKIQGFPSDYHMVGNQSDHKKFIGNSVVPVVPKVWAEAMGLKLLLNVKKKAA